MKRILLTGSQTWVDFNVIREAILQEVDISRGAVIVHGGCRNGADEMGDQVARAYGFCREIHEAIWRPYGIYNPQAGLMRSRKMVKLGADTCLAFIKNGSRGATYCASLAEEAGMPTKRFIA